MNRYEVTVIDPVGYFETVVVEAHSQQEAEEVARQRLPNYYEVWQPAMLAA